jgi:hypothetical protein
MATYWLFHHQPFVDILMSERTRLGPDLDDAGDVSGGLEMEERRKGKEDEREPRGIDVSAVRRKGAGRNSKSNEGEACMRLAEKSTARSAVHLM